MYEIKWEDHTFDAYSKSGLIKVAFIFPVACKRLRCVSQSACRWYTNVRCFIEKDSPLGCRQPSKLSCSTFIRGIVYSSTRNNLKRSSCQLHSIARASSSPLTDVNNTVSTCLHACHQDAAMLLQLFWNYLPVICPFSNCNTYALFWLAFINWL